LKCRGIGRLLRIASGHCHARAELRKTPGNAEVDAAGAPGDERRFAGQQLIFECTHVYSSTELMSAS
jgi:hypothetical protein